MIRIQTLKLNDILNIKQKLLELSKKNTELKNENTELKKQLQQDSFTGLYNKNYILGKIREAKPTTALIVADIDFFKKVNDTHGHIAGDEVLKKVAEIIKSIVRENDIASRFGGEEFLILCPNSSLADAVAIAERIRNKVEDTEIEIYGQVIGVTISLGIAELTNEESNKILPMADKALYKAKENGRNRIEICK